jgi:hypothetical protein
VPVTLTKKGREEAGGITMEGPAPWDGEEESGEQQEQ